MDVPAVAAFLGKAASHANGESSCPCDVQRTDGRLRYRASSVFPTAPGPESAGRRRSRSTPRAAALQAESEHAARVRQQAAQPPTIKKCQRSTTGSTGYASVRSRRFAGAKTWTCVPHDHRRAAASPRDRGNPEGAHAADDPDDGDALRGAPRDTGRARGVRRSPPHPARASQTRGERHQAPHGAPLPEGRAAGLGMASAATASGPTRPCSA
jgi:hypothetical protein